MNVPINEPFGELIWTAELRRRELGVSQNKAMAFAWDEELEIYLLIYEDIYIFV